MTKTLPLITIAITCYNAESTIKRAINSAFAQDWPNVEVLIVDDCSTDGSIRAIESLTQDKAQARFIRHDKNKGPAGTRNTLLKEARGEFIVFFDDDDESDSKRLRTQYERILAFEKTHPDSKIMCFASGIRIYPNGHKVNLPAIGSQGDETAPHGKDMADRLLFYGGDPSFFYGAGTPTCSLMARTETLKQIGRFDENFRRVEDVDLAIRMALEDAYFIGCSEILFTQYATQASDKNPSKNLQAEQQLAKKHEAYLRKKGRYYYAYYWPKLRYHYFMRQYGGMALTLLHLLIHHPIAVPKQLFNTGLKRLFHDLKINRKKLT